MSGRLSLTWANKDRALVSTDGGGYEWVSPDDPRAREIRLLDEVSTYPLVEEREARPETSPAENLLIRGDSLHALRSLARIPEYADEYRGRVKLVYIDPPFNTGQAFEHYDDALEHSVWLGMMRERLEAIRDLLAPDGSVWVHLDDAEMHYAKVLMDEIFGRQNFVAQFIWQKMDSPSSNNVSIANYHDHLLVFAADRTRFRAAPMVDPRILAGYPGELPDGRRFRDRILRKNGKSSLRSERPSMWYPIAGPDGTEVYPIDDDGIERRWGVGIAKVNELLAAGELIWKTRDKSGGGTHWVPYTREYAPEIPKRPWPTIWSDVLMNRQAKAQVKAVLPGIATFDTPKPEQLIERVLAIASDPGDIVLDAFAGSGTTAAAAHKMGRRWVTIEQQESTVDAFTRPRLVKVIDGEDPGGITTSAGWTGGGGFRELRVAPAAFEAVETDDFSAISLPESTDDVVLARSVAAQLGYYLDAGLDTPTASATRPAWGRTSALVGRKGRSRLAVVRGVADEALIEGLVSELDEGETLLVAATMMAPGTAEALRERNRGSRVLRIPPALFPAMAF